MLAMSRKAYRFPNPRVSLTPTDNQQQRTQHFEEAYVELHPGVLSGAFGDPKHIPDWVRNDRMFKMAFADGDIVVLQDQAKVTVPGPNEDAAKQATLTAAAVAAAGGTPSIGGEIMESPDSVDLESMTKAQLVAHAAEVHGLTLDPSGKRKDDLISAIQDHVSNQNISPVQR